MRLLPLNFLTFDLRPLEKHLNQDVILVSIMYVNHEVGSIMPIHEIHEIHEIGAIDTKATGQMLLRRFQHNCGCARTLQKS